MVWPFTDSSPPTPQLCDFLFPFPRNGSKDPVGHGVTQGQWPVWFILFEARSHPVAQASLRPMAILLPHPP